MKDGRCDENAKNIVARLDENVEMVVVLKMKRGSAIEDGDCAWMALNEPSALPRRLLLLLCLLLLEAVDCLCQYLHLLY